MRILVVNNFFPRASAEARTSPTRWPRGIRARGHEVLVLTAAYRDAPVTEEPEPACGSFGCRRSRSRDAGCRSASTWRSRCVRRCRGSFARCSTISAPTSSISTASSSTSPGRPAATRARRGVPALLSVHTRLENPKAHYHGVFRWLDAMVVRPILRRYRPRIVVMDVQMDEYIRHRYRGAFAGLDYIPVGVDPTRMSAVMPKSFAAATTRRRAGDRLARPRDPAARSDRPRSKRCRRCSPRVRTPRVLVVGQVYYDEFRERARDLGVADA